MRCILVSYCPDAFFHLQTCLHTLAIYHPRSTDHRSSKTRSSVSNTSEHTQVWDQTEQQVL